jgi:putative copper resistance protein D
MLKLGIFVIMLGFAAVNRFRLTPRLVLPPGNDRNIKALHQLTRNSTVETVLGLAVLIIVGMLGTLHPAVHLLK